MLVVLFFSKNKWKLISWLQIVPKIMLVQSFKAYCKKAGDDTMHNSLNPLPYFPYMHYPGQGKNWG